MRDKKPIDLEIEDLHRVSSKPDGSNEALASRVRELALRVAILEAKLDVIAVAKEKFEQECG